MRTRRNPSAVSIRRRRFSPLALIGVAVSLAVALVGSVIFLLPRLTTHAAAAVNGNCSLIVPAQPLSAQGLATPYQLVATNPADGACNEANAGQSAFVQAAVIDPATGNVSVYNPLVIDQGTQPAAAPVVPTLPANGIVGIWFGSNGMTLTLRGMGQSLQDGKCVNGLAKSLFGQFAYCNAPAFFAAANKAIQAKQLVPPALGTAKDNLPCPTVRDFSVVDQDQSDNVTTSYLVTANGQTAQANATNTAALQGAHPQANGSDNRLVAIALDTALGCTPWMAPDLANPGQMATALPLNELQAAAEQANPVALIPNRDPMVMNNNRLDMRKLNLYRLGVDQPPVQNQGVSSTTVYCNHLLTLAPQRLELDKPLTANRPSPDPAAANSLFTFLAQRLVTTYGKDGGLNCQGLLHKPLPVKVTTDDNGVATGATISSGLNCVVNGTMLLGCDGKATINGQICTFMMDQKAGQVRITCGKGGDPNVNTVQPDQNQPPQ